MLLKNLIKNLLKKKKIIVRDYPSTVNKLKRLYIFAIKGNKLNGEKYIKEAIKNGAIAIICSENCKYFDKKVPIIKTSNIRYF